MAVFLFFCALGSVGVTLWWTTQHLAYDLRSDALLGLAIIVALCLNLGMALQRTLDHS